MSMDCENILDLRKPHCATRQASKTEAMVDLVILYTLPFFALTTLLQEVSVLSYLNRFLAVFVLLFILTSLLLGALKKWMIIALCSYIAVSLIACSMTNWTDQVFACAPRGLFCVSLLFYGSVKFEVIKDFCISHIRYLQWIAITWCLLVASSIPLPSSWSIQWGGETYFTSYVRSAFQLMPTALIVMAINLMILRLSGNRRRVLLLSIIPIFAGLQGGSRTYFILIIIMFILILHNCKMSKLELGLVIVITAAVLLMAFATSGLGSKIASATAQQTMQWSGFDLLGIFTSGRSVFWGYDLNAFFHLDFLQQFVGNGYSFPYEVNAEKVGNSIYAHNDFINLVMESGYIGLIVYLLAVASLFKQAKQAVCSRWVLLLVLILWFVNAFLNSFYPYTSAVIAYVLTVAALGIKSFEPLGESAR